MDIDDLTTTLKKLTEGEISEEEALKDIKRASPTEISKAEQNLLEEGISESELQKFCKVHLKAIDEKVERMKNELPKGHPIRTLILEHDEILTFLDKLESLSEKLENGLNLDQKDDLKDLAEHLVETEKHHEREEKTIFPRMRDRGITGPPRMMELEHDDLRLKKNRLLELTEDVEENKDEIKELIDYIIFHLRDHIFKENNILYPSAIDSIEEWDKIKEEGKNIGFCCFTPEEG